MAVAPAASCMSTRQFGKPTITAHSRCLVAPATANADPCTAASALVTAAARAGRRPYQHASAAIIANSVSELNRHTSWLSLTVPR